MRKVSILIPTLNEKENIPLIVARLTQILKQKNWEIAFIDDNSQDGSKEVLKELALSNPCIRVIHRTNQTGLSSACLQGMESSSSDLFAVLDCDLQHDETLLPQMLQAFEENPNLELAVGTRYSDNQTRTGNWNKKRVLASLIATKLGKLLQKTPLSDPMSGFFIIRRELFEETRHRVTGRGFKILLDIVLSAQRPLNLQEFPYHFRPRQYGKSKLNLLVALEYIYLLIRHLRFPTKKPTPPS